jgi:hypothetical protein
VQVKRQALPRETDATRSILPIQAILAALTERAHLLPAR